MGRQRGRKGNDLFLHGACLLALIVVFTGCASVQKYEKVWQGRRHFNRAEQLLAAGDYERALAAYERIVGEFPEGYPGDAALFRMGLIWAHPENPNQDYEKAREYFQRMTTRFPATGLSEEERALIGAVDELVRCAGLTAHQQETMKGLRKQLDDMKRIDIGIEEKRKNLLNQ